MRNWKPPYQPTCKGSLGARAIDVDHLIEMLEPYRGQNRRVLFRPGGYGSSPIRTVDTDRDGDIILKGPR